MIDDSVLIIPYRNIPFDIGRSLDERFRLSVKDYLLKKEKAVELEADKLLKTLSADVLCVFQIKENIRLYIYKFGIGVFTVKDSETVFNKETYAVDYCKSRKAAHESYLTISNSYSEVLFRIAENIRALAALNKNKLRLSADAKWENNGFSYVMTVSSVYQANGNYTYRAMNNSEKKSLHIMLEPSIAHAEDSMVCSLNPNEEDQDVNDLDLSSLEEPTDWIKSSDFSIYISWAAVLIYSSSKETMTYKVMEALEVDLQAMWLYTYCMYENLKRYASSHKMLASKLRMDLYEYKRKYNEFNNIDDSSVPAYVTRLRNELIRTSGIEDYAAKYIEYLEYCVVETESINSEKQRKYSCLNEILLFIIAFVQIAPMLYDVMTNGIGNIDPVPVIIMAVIVVAAIATIILKD